MAISSELDPIDGAPLWSFDEGEPFVPGCLAWERLGTGTRCETWLAWSVDDWSPVVVKLTRPEQATHPRGKAAVSREADALGSVRHIALPRLLVDGRDAAVPHLVVQYVDGPSLGDLLDDTGPWQVSDACMLGAQIVSAVRTLHLAGYAHLDLKPDNVLIQGGRAVVVDLGSSRTIAHRQPSDRPIGTSGYASPDLEAGDDVAAAMDVYGAGLVIAEAAVGTPIFDPELRASERPNLLTDNEIPASLRGLVSSMLEPLAADRPTTDDVLLALPTIMGEQEADETLWPAWASDHLSSRRTPLAYAG